MKIFPTTLALFAAVIAQAGCAPTNVRVMEEYNGMLPRPSQVLVYDFAVSPDEVKLDQGISGKIEHLVEKTPRTAEERTIGHAEADALAKYLVEDLRKFGLPTERAVGYPEEHRTILQIHGQFISIDEGNQAERVVIGLGAGRTDVKTLTQAVQTGPDGRFLAEEFETDAKSGYKPGAAETMGVGAVSGHLAVSAVGSTALAGASEVWSANVDADARRTAKALAKDIGQFYVMQGWVPESATW